MDFELTPNEREFFRKHLIGVQRPGTAAPALLGRLAEKDVGAEAADLWVNEISEVADDKDQRALQLARKSASLAGIGRSIYAALAEIARADDGLAASERHQDHLQQMVQVHGREARTLNLIELYAVLPSLPASLRRVLDETQDWLKSTASGPRALRNAYARAEFERKGSRARLPDTRAGSNRRKEWDPVLHPLAEPLHYRWPNVNRLLRDLQTA